MSLWGWGHHALYAVDWQAVGLLLAVPSAAIVAWRQNGLKRLEIKISLLDRRLEVIDRLREARRAAANPRTMSDEFLRHMFFAFNLGPAVFKDEQVHKIETIRSEVWEATYSDHRDPSSVDWKALARLIDQRFPSLIDDLIAHARVDL